MEELKSLKKTTSELRGQLKERDAQIAFLRKDIKELNAQITFLRKDIEDLNAQMEPRDAQIAFLHEAMVKQDNARFKMFHANILVDFIKKVFGELGLKSPGNLEDPKTETSKTRYAQAAQSLSQRQLEVFFKEKGKQLGPQYYKVLQNMSQVRLQISLNFPSFPWSDLTVDFFQYIDERNRTAHETHIEFAQLLHSDEYREKKDYWKWANLFPSVYGKTVEQFVMEEDDAAQNKIAEEGAWEPAY